jgi:hypothetical protein
MDAECLLRRSLGAARCEPSPALSHEGDNLVFREIQVDAFDIQRRANRCLCLQDEALPVTAADPNGTFPPSLLKQRGKILPFGQ